MLKARLRCGWEKGNNLINMKRRLSKSKLISGWQCHKRLWLEPNEPDEKIFSAATQAAFDVGHRVGAAAQQQFPAASSSNTIRSSAKHWNKPKTCWPNPAPSTCSRPPSSTTVS